MTLALVVRSGIFELKTHDEPINTAMRSAMAEKNPQLSTEDSLTVDRLYSTAQKLPSGLRYIIRNFGTGDKKTIIMNTKVSLFLIEVDDNLLHRNLLSHFRIRNPLLHFPRYLCARFSVHLPFQR